MTFSILFLLLNIRCVRLIHVVTFGCSLLITIKLYSILWVSHHLFIPSTIYENLYYCNIMTHALWIFFSMSPGAHVHEFLLVGI